MQKSLKEVQYVLDEFYIFTYLVDSCFYCTCIVLLDVSKTQITQDKETRPTGMICSVNVRLL